MIHEKIRSIRGDTSYNRIACIKIGVAIHGYMLKTNQLNYGKKIALQKKCIKKRDQFYVFTGFDIFDRSCVCR